MMTSRDDKTELKTAAAKLNRYKWRRILPKKQISTNLVTPKKPSQSLFYHFSTFSKREGKIVKKKKFPGKVFLKKLFVRSRRRRHCIFISSFFNVFLLLCTFLPIRAENTA